MTDAQQIEAQIQEIGKAVATMHADRRLLTLRLIRNNPPAVAVGDDGVLIEGNTPLNKAVHRRGAGHTGNKNVAELIVEHLQLHEVVEQFDTERIQQGVGSFVATQVDEGALAILAEQARAFNDLANDKSAGSIGTYKVTSVVASGNLVSIGIEDDSNARTRRTRPEKIAGALNFLGFSASLADDNVVVTLPEDKSVADVFQELHQKANVRFDIPRDECHEHNIEVDCGPAR